jgi:hypothetical protein
VAPALALGRNAVIGIIGHHPADWDREKERHHSDSSICP